MSSEHHPSTLWVLLPLFFVLVIDAMGMAIILPIIGPLFMDPSHGILPATASEHWRSFYYGLTLTVFFICMFFGAPFLGDLSDRYGRRKTIIICLFATAISYLMCAIGIYFGSLVLLLLGRAFAGFMAGSQPIAQAAIIDVSLPEEKTKNIALITFASSLGFIIGPLLGGFFSGISYSSGFYVAGGLACINGLFVLSVFKETYQTREKTPIHLLKAISLLAAAFQHKELRILSFIFFFTQLAWGLYFQFVSIFFVSAYHYSSMMIGLFLASIAVVFGLTLTFLLRILMRFFSIRELALLALSLISIGVFLDGFFHKEWLMWLTIIPTIIGVGLSYASMMTLYSNQVPQNQQGWAMGVSSATIAVAWILGGGVTAVVGVSFLKLPFIICGVSALIGFFLLLKAHSLKKEHPFHESHSK